MPKNLSACKVNKKILHFVQNDKMRIFAVMNKLNKTQLLPDRPGIPPMAKLPEPEVVDPAALA